MRKKDIVGMSITFMCGLLSCYVWGWIFSPPAADAVPPSPVYVRALINDCGAFTGIEGSARRALAVTLVGQQLDSGGMTFADIEWQWIAGSLSTDRTIHKVKITLIYSSRYDRWIVFSFPRFSGGDSVSYPCDEKE